jgi:membrane protein
MNEPWSGGRALRRRLLRIWLLARRVFRVVWTVLITAVRGFGDARSPEAAAGLAYYATFTLFPLLLFVIVFGSSVLESERVQYEILQLVSRVLPTSQELVVENVQRVLEQRGSASLLAGLSLLWSSTGFFTTLVRQVNRVWPDAADHNVVELRILALGMVAGLAVLLAMWLTLSVAVVPHLPAAWLAGWGVLRPLLRPMLTRVLGWIVPLMFLVATYRIIPKRRVGWLEALIAAAVATIGWRLVTTGFSWYLASNLTRYRLVYGSLASMMVLMIWIYLCAQIMLFGASLCAAIAMCRRSSRRHWVL